MTAAAAPVRPHFVRLFAALCLLVLPAVTGCDEDTHGDEGSAKPAQAMSGEVASFSFDAVVYVDTTLNNIAVIDRVRSVMRSGFSALQHRRITTSQKRQVDVDLKRLWREPVTVVDPVTKASHPAIRVRYRFVGVGLVPKELGQRGDALLGLLHSADAARAVEVVEACNDPAERAGDAVKQPWRAFDPGLESCGRAMEAEQIKIDTARAGLEHPEREIVPLEETRLYLPVLLRMRTRATRPVRPVSTPGEIERNPAAAAPREAPPKPDELGTIPVEQPRAIAAPSPSSGRPQGDVADPRPAAAAVKPNAPPRVEGDGADLYPDTDPAVLLAKRSESRLLARLKEQDRDKGKGQDDYGIEDDPFRRPAVAPGAAPGGDELGSHGQSSAYSSGSHESPTNYALLWVASIAVLAIFGAEIHRRFLRRR